MTETIATLSINEKNVEMGKISNSMNPCIYRTLRVKRLRDTARIPVYGSEGAACFDFYACLDKDEIVVPPHSSVKVGTGLVVALERGTVLFMYSRSGHGFKHGVRFVNCVGVIDSDYRGEIMVGLHNDSDTEYVVKNGERVAQGLVQSYIPVAFLEVDKLDETERGTGGFGSTGK